MSDLPTPGIEPVSLALADRFLTTEPPEKSEEFIYFIFDCAGLHCCVGFCLVADSRGYSLVAVHRLLIAAASLGQHGLQGDRKSVV